MKEYGWPIADVTVHMNNEASQLADFILSRANEKWLRGYVSKLEEKRKHMMRQHPVPFAVMHTTMMLDKARKLLAQDKRTANGLSGS